MLFLLTFCTWGRGSNVCKGYRPLLLTSLLVSNIDGATHTPQPECRVPDKHRPRTTEPTHPNRRAKTQKNGAFCVLGVYAVGLRAGTRAGGPVNSQTVSVHTRPYASST